MSPHDRAAAAQSYPFPTTGTTYNPYPTPSSYPTPYSYTNSAYPPQQLDRPRLRRGDPYDAYSEDELDHYEYEADVRRESLSRHGSFERDMAPAPPSRRSSGIWDPATEGRQRYPEHPAGPRPQTVRGDSGYWSDYAPDSRDSGVFVS